MFRKILLATSLLATAIVIQSSAATTTPLQQAEAIQAEIPALQAKLQAAKTATEEGQAKLNQTKTAVDNLVASLKEEKPKEEPPQPTWHGFTDSNPMPGDQTIFSPTSFVNQKVPANPVVLSNSAAMVKEFASHLNNIWTDEGYGRPLYYAKSTDPLLKVSGVKYGTWANGLLIHVPAKASPAVAPCWPVTPTSCGGDHHIAIVEPNGELFDFWAVKNITSTELIAGGAGYAKDLGASSGVSEREAGSTASGFNNITGSVRPEELAAHHINHELTGPVNLTKSGCHVGPAKESDGTSSSPNAPCQGQLFYYEDTVADIQSKPWPLWEKTYMIALVEYGFRADDSGGGGGFTAKGEAPVDRIVFGHPNPFNEALKGEPGLKEATGAGGKAYILEFTNVDWSKLRAING